MLVWVYGAIQDAMSRKVLARKVLDLSVSK
jgi:hypothetical protein